MNPIKRYKDGDMVEDIEYLDDQKADSDHDSEENDPDSEERTLRSLMTKKMMDQGNQKGPENLLREQIPK